MTRSKPSLSEKVICHNPKCSKRLPSANEPELCENTPIEVPEVRNEAFISPNCATPANSLSDEEVIEDNALERCKRNAEKGIFALEELLEVCEKDPDSLLRAHRRKHARNQEHSESCERCGQCSGECIEFYSIRQTHGEKFGDPKYHYLMVDVSTSIEFPKPELTDQNSLQGVMRSNLQLIGHSGPDLLQDDLPEPSVLNEHQPEEEEGKHEQPFDDKLLLNKYTIDHQSTEQMPLIRESIEEETPDGRPTELQITEIVPGTPKYEKRNSNVNWDELLGTDPPMAPSPMTDSMEKIVMKATSKADQFRHHTDIQKHYSLLGNIVREERIKTQDNSRKNSVEIKQADMANLKPKKFFSLMKTNKKTKAIAEEEAPTHQSDETASDTESKPKSQSSVNSYRRRFSPPINPVFEKDDEINKYLDNLTRK